MQVYFQNQNTKNIMTASTNLDPQSNTFDYWVRLLLQNIVDVTGAVDAIAIGQGYTAKERYYILYQPIYKDNITEVISKNVFDS